MAAQNPIQNPILFPDTAGDLEELQRQQKYADLLRQQALTPLDTNQMAGGRVVPLSWTQGLANMFKAYTASNMEKDIAKQRGEIQKRNAQVLAGMLPTMTGGDAPAPYAPAAASTNGSAAPSPAAPSPSGGSSLAPGEQGGVPNVLDPMARIRRAATAAYLMGNTDLANKLIGNALEVTNNQKDWAAQGLDPRLLGQLEVAERRKKGIIELQPGTTALDLATGQERFQPKVGEGIALNNGVASQVPGYAAANAGIQGAQTQAQEQAKAGMDMVTINTPNGPVMVTRAQAVQMAGGAKPQSNIQMPPTNGAGLDLRGMSPQQAIEMANGIQDPQERAKYLQTLGQWAQQPQSQAGIPLQGEAGKASEVERGKFFGSNYADLQKGAMDANAKIAKYDRMASLLDGVSTGKLTPAGTDLAAYAQSVGLNVDPKLGNKQAAMALANEIALQLRNPSGGAGMPGALSDKDREFLMSMTPSLAATPEGNKTLIEGMKKLAKRDQEIAQLARQYNNGNLDNGFYQVVQDYANSHPLFQAPAGNGNIHDQAAAILRGGK
jgi:hypothetical protein